MGERWPRRGEGGREPARPEEGGSGSVERGGREDGEPGRKGKRGWKKAGGPARKGSLRRAARAEVRQEARGAIRSAACRSAAFSSNCRASSTSPRRDLAAG